MNLNDLKSTPGCFLPMNAMTIHPHGQAHYCLTSSDSFPENLQQLQAQQQETHQKMQQGHWPEGCGRCQRKEEKGQQSRRLHTWQRKEKIYGSASAQDFVTNAKAPAIRHLDISFSNSCNLSCAICSSEFSSSWIKHDKEAVESGLEFRNFTQPFQKISRLSPEMLDYIDTQIDKIDLVIIKGGEPTREPLCLDFLKRISQSQQQSPSKNLNIFIQSNGTHAPEKWLNGLETLNIEIGISMDGWGDVFNWIRGPYFDQVLANIGSLNNSTEIKSITLDFTLSAFNVFHLPVFLEKALELKQQHAKIKECPVFQWVHQDYASPLAIPLEDRKKILEKCLPILEKHKDFFLDFEVLVDTLQRPRLKPDAIQITRRWFDYLQKIRTTNLGPDADLIHEALTSQRA